MNDLQHIFSQFIEKYQLCNNQSKIIVAVSGGLDSVVLFNLFKHWSPKELVICHMNHGLRGPEADEDERFVHSMAVRNDVRFFSYKTDVEALASKMNMSIEEAARMARLTWLEQLVRCLGFDVVALGHHEQDQTETVLMHLIRGAGLRGVAGIRPARGVFIRPLLECSKQDLYEYASEHNILFSEDVTNKDRRFLRNRIRLDVIPALNKAAGFPVYSSVNRSAQWIREAYTDTEIAVDKYLSHAITRVSDRELWLDISQFFNYFKSIQKSILISVIESFYEDIYGATYPEIERLLNFVLKGKTDQTLIINNIGITRSHDTLFMVRIEEKIEKRDVKINNSIEIPEAGLVFACKWCSMSDKININSRSDTEYLSVGNDVPQLFLRSFKPGDRFIPLGSSSFKKVSHFFIDCKVNRWKRQQVPIIEIDGEIAWVVGYRIDQRFKITPDTKRILKVSIKTL
ncbi:tRNA lysidine(34) synthetase TilS [bacterium]|nr:tRNA lysidine(34) synthetase TilS [bacterium]